MIHLVLGEADPFRREETPPAPYFRFDEEILSKEGSQTVARYLANGFWRSVERHHTYGEFVGRAHICFDGGDEDRSQPLGPYEKVWIAGGSIYADDKMVAQFMEDHRRWRSVKDGTCWPAIVVKAA